MSAARAGTAMNTACKRCPYESAPRFLGPVCKLRIHRDVVCPLLVRGQHGRRPAAKRRLLYLTTSINELRPVDILSINRDAAQSFLT